MAGVGWMRAAARRGAGAAILYTCVTGGPAGATATLDCSASDGAVAFDIAAAVSHGMGAALTNVRANLTLKAKGVPPPLAAFSLDGEALVHHWILGRALKLHFYHERTEVPAATLELVIQTRGSGAEEDGFAGRYLLTFTEPGQGAADGRTHTFKGKVTCGLG